MRESNVVDPVGVSLDLTTTGCGGRRRGFGVYEVLVLGEGVVLEVEVEVPGADDAVAAA